MRTIGLLGGMSWQSTVSYYRYLNEGVGARLGGRHSADIRLWSGDFEPLARATEERDWDLTSRVLCEAARLVVSSGAQLLVMAAKYPTGARRHAGRSLSGSSGMPFRKLGQSRTPRASFGPLG